MFKFKGAVLASLLGVGAAADIQAFHTYSTTASVSDHAGISLDQAVIETLVAKGTDVGFAAAKNVYMQGGNSKSVARLRPASPLSEDLPKGTEITGGSVMASTASGSAYKDFAAGDNTIEVKYSSDCRIGGLPINEQVRDGCFAEQGTDQGTTAITIGDSTYEYSYDLTGGTFNGRTIQGFSTNADKKMKPAGAEEFFPTFQPFVDYYEDHAYADKIIMAAFDGTDAFSWKFSDLDYSGRAQIAKKGTAYLATGAYVIRELEDAVDDCVQVCQEGVCSDAEKVGALDEAAAFYVGANQATDPDGLGNLFYALPEKRCQNFGTCANGVEGQSKVNEEIFQQFSLMNANLMDSNCEAASMNTAEIVKNMNVAMIQGMLRYAWIVDNEDPSDKLVAEGAIFAAGVLPEIAACDAEAADTIFEAVNVGGTPNFAEVKTAAESVYECMGITCADVGGLIDSTGTAYADGAAPCDGVSMFD